MISRSLKVPKSKSFLLFGPRGTGKSTWLESEFSLEGHLWIDLTNPDVERRYARRPAILLDEWKVLAGRMAPSVPWVIVDEVQKIPLILDVAHFGIQKHRMRFALTGSSARKLRRGAGNLLAGRAQTFHMHPLTWRELGAGFELDRFLRWGGLPEVCSTEDVGDRRRFLDSYCTTYLREEIQIEQLVRRIEPFRMFLDVAGQSSGEVINIARIAREADIDPKSAERYFEVLNDTLIGRYLPAYHRSIRKRQLSHPKFYLFDVGVWGAIRRELVLEMLPQTPLYGRAFEHFIVQQILALNEYCETNYALSYCRTKDNVEADLVVERPGAAPVFIEIKSSASVREADVREFADLARDAGAESIVLCQAEREFVERGVRVVPWRTGLDELFPERRP